MVVLLVAACASRSDKEPAAPSSPAVDPSQPVVETPRPGDRLARLQDEIVVCGELFHTGTRVVLWNDPGGYDAYRPHRHFAPDEALPQRGSSVARFGSYRRQLPAEIAQRVREKGWRLEDLQQVVSQFVIHYDVAGTSTRCFRILHDIRGLSCHFLLDIDGTIYQTLDLKERAWHAGVVNDLSVGIEIAQIGAYPDMKTLNQWYARDANGTRLTLPPSIERGNLPPDFVGRPARPEPVKGEIHGGQLFQYDYTDAQYEALAKLVATLARVLPKIRPDVPRDANGALLRTTLGSEEELRAYEGLLGHYHITRSKIDPGPAFDWERLLGSVEEHLQED